jgi:hypothetical protein
VQRPLKFARYLPEFGWDVTVLTPAAGSYHATDNSLIAELPDSVRVQRVRTFDPTRWIGRMRSSPQSVSTSSTLSTPSTSSIGRPLELLREWLRWPDSRRAFVGPAARRAARLAEARPFDLVWTTSPPPSTHLIGMRLQNRLEIPWVADFRDPWFACFDYWGPTRWHKRYAQNLRARIAATADGLVAASETIASSLSDASETANLARPRQPVTVIYNGFDESDFTGVEPAPRENEVFTILLYGTFSDNPDPEPIFTLLGEWQRTRPSIPFRIRHVGLSLGGDESALATRCGLGDRFESVGYLQHAQSIQALMSADLVVLSVSAHPGYQNIVPGRVFEMLRSLRPILLLAPGDCEVSRLLRPIDGCWIVPKDDLRAGVAAFDQIAALPRNAPVRAVSSIRQYDRREQTRQLAALFENLKSTGPRTGAR